MAGLRIPVFLRGLMRLFLYIFNRKKMPITLRGWQRMFRDIFYEKDKRDYTAAEILEHVQEEASRIDKGIRKENWAEVIAAIPRFFCWLLSFFNMIGIDAEIAIWRKYQGRCPYCGVERNCGCIALDEKPDHPDKWVKSLVGTMPASLDDWQNMFFRIFGKINRLVWAMQVWLHVHEELGELSREVRLGNIIEIHYESADCMAWLLGFCNRIGVKLGEATWEVYPGICDVCRQGKCQCPKV